MCCLEIRQSPKRKHRVVSSADAAFSSAGVECDFVACAENESFFLHNDHTSRGKDDLFDFSAKFSSALLAAPGRSQLT